MRFQFARLLGADFPACFRFYRDVLGFQPTFGSETDGYADFDTGEVTLALFDRAEMSEALGARALPQPDGVQDRACLVFSVDNVDSACERMKASGVRIVAPPTDHADWGIRTAHLRDPDGNLIEINQPIRS